jgi:hypothetical protein
MGPRLKGIMENFNDDEFRRNFVAPDESWGSIVAKATYTRNEAVKSIPCLDGKAERARLMEMAEIMGLIWEYTTLKEKARQTQRYGFPDAQDSEEASTKYILQVSIQPNPGYRLFSFLTSNRNTTTQQWSVCCMSLKSWRAREWLWISKA